MKSQGTGSFRIQGGRPIHGKVTLQGSKNEALSLLVASLLTEEEVILGNIPPIEDVFLMEQILSSLGVSVRKESQGLGMKYHLQTKNDPSSFPPPELCGLLRGSVTIAGPLLARNGEVLLPRPGGDSIGRRRIDTHILALQALGASTELTKEGVHLRCAHLRGADILLDEASVTATESVVCASVLAEGESKIQNAACEPHVQGLCHMLNAMGAKIQGIGSNILEIEGVKKLKGTYFQATSDTLEAGSFIALAAITGGELFIENPDLPNLRMIRMVFSKLGISTKVEKGGLLVSQGQKLEVMRDFGGAIPRIDSAPWPGFPADMTSIALVIATQCNGTVLIHEKLFESRLFFTDRLIAMGARIVLCDPHRALVIGPAPLQGAVLSSPDIRAGMALLAATLCAKGESKIQNILQIDRGFASIDTRLQALGADIERL